MARTKKNRGAIRRYRINQKVMLANKRLAETKEVLGTDHEAVKYALNQVKLSSKDRRRTQFSIPKNATEKELELLSKTIDKFLASKYTSKSGRESIKKNRYDTFKEKFEWTRMSKKRKELMDKMLTAMGTSAFQHLQEMKMGTSEIYMEELKDEIQSRPDITVDELEELIESWL